MSDLDAALHRRLDGAIRASGTLRLLPVPAAVDRFASRLAETFAGAGCPLDDDARASLRQALLAPLDEAHAAGPRARVEVRWRAPGGGLKYRVKAVMLTPAEAYEEWASGRPQPHAAADPDAAVLAAAAQIPAGSAVLDLGAGTGRNAAALAASGHNVLAVEAAPALAKKLRAAGLRVIEGDVLDPALPVPPNAHPLVVASAIATQLPGPAALRRLLATACDWLAPGGVFLLDAFVCDPGYDPPEIVRQASAALGCTAFTRGDLDDAMAGLPLALRSDALAAEAEAAGRDRWPPTGWYEGWAAGRDLFDLDAPPVALRWLTFARG